MRASVFFSSAMSDCATRASSIKTGADMFEL
jgi:hypothetical protein